MFGRRTRTLLPTASPLLVPPTAASAQIALTAAKTHQAHYYDKRARQARLCASGKLSEQGLMSRIGERHKYHVSSLIAHTSSDSKMVQPDDVLHATSTLRPTRSLARTEIMFGRRTRTLLPTVSALLVPPTAASAQGDLTAAKTRQAHYYNKRAAPRPPLRVGETVRARFDEQDWRKAQVSRVLPYRLYQLRFEDGSTRRRTSRHVHKSAEPPIIIKTEDPDDDGTLTQPIRQHTPPPRSPDATAAVLQPHPQRNLQEESQREYRTRSGRSFRKPARFGHE